MISLEEEMPELTLEDKETLERKKVGTGQGRESGRVWGHRSLVDTTVLERAGAVHQGLPIS